MSTNETPRPSKSHVWDGAQWLTLAEARDKYGPFIQPGMAYNGTQWVKPNKPRTHGCVIALFIVLIPVLLYFIAQGCAAIR